MRRIRSVVAVATVAAAMAAFAGPGMADVDFDDDLYEERLEERADLFDEYYVEVEDAYENGLFIYNPFFIYEIDDDVDLELDLD